MTDNLQHILTDLRQLAQQFDMELYQSLVIKLEKMGIFFDIRNALHHTNIRNSIFKIENLLELNNTLPTEEQRLVIYVELYGELDHDDRELEDDEIQKLVAALGLSPRMAENLCEYHNDEFRKLTVARLETKIDEELCRVDLHAHPSIRAHHQRFHSIFDHHGFVTRMFSGDLNLQDLALMKAHGGVLFLEDAFDLKATNNQQRFLFNYRNKYYTRQCHLAQPDWSCAQGAGRYADIEMIEEKYMDYLIDVITGAVQAGHLDIVQKYTPVYYESDGYDIHEFRQLLVEAASHDRVEIYHYLMTEFYPPPDLSTLLGQQILFAAARHGALRFFQFFIGQIQVNEFYYRGLAVEAVTGGNRDIIQLLEANQWLELQPAVVTAAGTGDVELIQRWLPQLSPADRWSMGSVYGKTNSVEVCQKLFDAGVRPHDVYIYNNIGNVDFNLDVLKFLLDNFGVDGLVHFRLGERPDVSENARDYLKQIDVRRGMKALCQGAFLSENEQVVTMILDHPRLAEYQPCEKMWHVITRTEFLEGNDNRVTVTTAAFIPVVAHMLVARGFRIDVCEYTAEKRFMLPHVRNFISWYAKNIGGVNSTG